MFLFLVGCWAFVLAYSWIIMKRWYIWQKMPLFQIKHSIPDIKISVLIPVRNEAESILYLLQDLEAQSYPSRFFEVLVIDDHSDDATAAVIFKFRERSKLNLKLIHLQNFPGSQQKKAAIGLGNEMATGELILQTDGDCRVSEHWLMAMAQFYFNTKAKCISGPVCLNQAHSIFTRMQVVEFAALIGVGGASMALGQPNMCNGANLAYSRQAFFEVNGFAGNDHLASGDDEFLMHKLADRFPGEVLFFKAPEAIVLTAAKTNLPGFLQQRVRWASKWPNYQKKQIKMLAITVFGTNFLLFLSLGLGLAGLLTAGQITTLYGLKFLVDGLFLTRVLAFFKRQRLTWYILPLQLVYIPYVLYTALLGLRGSYSWKGRQVK